MKSAPEDSPLGLVAGEGDLPVLIAQNARKAGRRLVTVALDSLAHESVLRMSDVSTTLNVGKVGAVMKFLRKNGVKEAVLAGKVPKVVLYGSGGVSIRPDLRAVSMLLKLKDRKDDSILDAVSREFEKEGIRLLDMKEFCSDLLTPAGPLTRRRPTKAEAKDMEFGFKMAKEIGRLDIGQTVVVKDRAVMAVEAIEGTDEAILRGGGLAGGGAVVVKVSRPGQDMRFDVPVVGMSTLRSMIKAGALALALEAGKSLIMGREEFIGKADEAGIAVTGIAGGDAS